MATQIRSTLLLSAALAGAMAAAVAAARPGQAGLVVHEWGTFTSVAGPTGWSVDWAPLSGPQDLPCFVSHQTPTQPGLGNIQVKGRDIYGLLRILPQLAAASGPATASGQAPTIAVPPAVMTAKVRMETPVLYFYSRERVDVDVKVSFRQGVMSEWYPAASVPAVNLAQPLVTTTGSIEWPSVEVRPGVDVTYPQDAVKSHYYAARDVDAAPLQVGGQFEKFLFYRGLADFQPTITATVERNGDVVASVPPGTTGLVLFERRHGHVGYRVGHVAGDRVTLSRPRAGSVDALRTNLETMLTASGLYPREAKAMVETWRDSWFEEGTRIFYVIPKAVVDERLPLTISPAPAEISRVFVGRLELITPDIKDDVERAIVNNDLDTLSSYGRFLDSIVLQLGDRPAITKYPARTVGALSAVARSSAHPAACQ